MTSNRHNGILDGVDRGTVLLYVLIVLAGFVSIISASYDDSAAQLFSFSHFYMKQLIWIAVAWVTALVVLLLDERFYHMFAYPAYFAGLGLLVAALLFGREEIHNQSLHRSDCIVGKDSCYLQNGSNTAGIVIRSGSNKEIILETLLKRHGIVMRAQMNRGIRSPHSLFFADDIVLPSAVHYSRGIRILHLQIKRVQNHVETV